MFVPIWLIGLTSFMLAMLVWEIESSKKGKEEE